jgi:type II secretory ATPase GspE/PulE/Tfp pilus assembly ATPase PilB-like protein
VNAVLRTARDAGASDVHLDPAAHALAVRWRLDGVLQPLTEVPKEVGPNVIARLKVLAGLLTYEMSLPQEGRIWDEELRVEVRVSTFPTLYGERAVLRLLGASNSALDSLSQLGLPEAVLGELRLHLAATSGAILIVGPAGSGKTTTAYACLRHVVSQSGGGRSIASLEDPVEVAVDGVAQSQVNLAAEFDMATGLRSLLRLDPEVILIGEMRDRATAEIALQAALTGQLVVTTFHAGNCGDAVRRLVEIGIPPYAVRNAVRLVVAQRLVRRLCACAQQGDMEKDARAFGLDVEQFWVAGACEACRATGYRGRALVAEWRTVDDAHADSTSAAGDEQLWKSATALVEAGVTSPQEVVRVLGLRRS